MFVSRMSIKLGEGNLKKIKNSTAMEGKSLLLFESMR